MRATVDAVRKFLDEVLDTQPTRVLAIGTAALREADNGARVRAALRKTLGVDVKVLTGAEEARLGALAALSVVPMTSGVVFDLGGGSLQLSRVSRGVPTPLASLPLGALRMTLAHVRHDPPRRVEMEAVRTFARRLLEPIVREASGGSLVGIGGTVRGLAQVIRRAHGRRDELRGRARLTRAEVAGTTARLADLSRRERRRVRGLKRDRIETIVAGGLVVDELMALGGWDALTVCSRGVRHGLLVDVTRNGHGAR